MRIKSILLLLGMLALLAFTPVAPTRSASFTITMDQGDSGAINCNGAALAIVPVSITQTTVSCLAAEIVPTVTPTTATPAPTAAPATLAPTPTASATPAASVFPIKAAFFYPWFPQSWTQLGVYPYTNYHPSLGYYSSIDD